MTRPQLAVDASRRRPVGVSTGSFGRLPLLDAVALAVGLPGDVVEVSALDSRELGQLPGAVAAARVSGRAVVLHAPAKGPRADERDLVELLAGFGLDVVAHPDVFVDVAAWARLGDRLLVENMDARKTCGRDVDELEGLFAVLPDARMCLDVSHARDALGPGGAVTLARHFAGRVGHVHVGCGCGSRPGPDLDAGTVDELAQTLRLAPADAAVIYERSVDPDSDLTVVAGELTRLGHTGAPGRR